MCGPFVYAGSNEEARLTLLLTDPEADPMPHLQPTTPRADRVAAVASRRRLLDGVVDAASAEDDANAYLLQGGGAPALIDCASLAGRAQIEANCAPPASTSRARGAPAHALALGPLRGRARVASSYGLRTHLNAVGAGYIDRGDQR